MRGRKIQYRLELPELHLTVVILGSCERGGVATVRPAP